MQHPLAPDLPEPDAPSLGETHQGGNGRDRVQPGSTPDGARTGSPLPCGDGQDHVQPGSTRACSELDTFREHEVRGALEVPDAWRLRTGQWVAPQFQFANGAVMDALRIAYTTLGDPRGEPVLVLHGSNGSGAGLLTPDFAGALFGAGQALDATRHFIILPDGIGCGGSSKPSDGLGRAFPRYTYADMVSAQHRLVTEHFGLEHLRLVLGYSMGGMHTWLWAEQHPEFMDIAVPLACQPTPLAGRNWMLRRLLMRAIERDPANLQWASLFFGVATNGGTQALHALAPDSAAADAWVEAQLHAPFEADADDHRYQWDAGRDYDASADLARIRCTVLAINACDDERNPPELGVVERALALVPQARALWIPAGPHTAGHGTVLKAQLWQQALAEVLAGTARRLPSQGAAPTHTPPANRDL